MATSGIFDQPDSTRQLAIEVEEKTFWVSREMLAIYSPVFKAMLYGEFDEDIKDVIKLPGKKAIQMEELLLCLLPHPQLKEIDDWNFQFLLELSDKYEIEEIPIRVEQFLIEKLNFIGKSDRALLQLLAVGSKYRMKEFLSVCVRRCVCEFSFDRMKTTFPSLRAEVVASLAIAALASPVNSECRFNYFNKASKKHPAICANCEIHTHKRHIKCALCGCAYCGNHGHGGNCVNVGGVNGKNCGGDGSAAKYDIQNMLYRM